MKANPGRINLKNRIRYMILTILIINMIFTPTLI